MNVLLYLMGGRSNNVEENSEQIFSEVQTDFVKALMVNPDLLKDEYVKSQILKTLKRKIKDAKIGRLWVRGIILYLDDVSYKIKSEFYKVNQCSKTLLYQHFYILIFLIFLIFPIIITFFKNEG